MDLQKITNITEVVAEPSSDSNSELSDVVDHDAE